MMVLFAILYCICFCALIICVIITSQPPLNEQIGEVRKSIKHFKQTVFDELEPFFRWLLK